jgi:hypothetical protein
MELWVSVYPGNSDILSGKNRLYLRSREPFKDYQMNSNNALIDIRKWFFIIICFNSFLVNVPAQNLPFLFSGVVSDSSSRKPLQMVHVYLKSTGFGVVTDTDGKYKLQVPILPDTMVISCIGYETQKIGLSIQIKARQNIILKPKIMVLKEVVITPEKAVAFFRDEHYSVLDYAIDRMNIYLLVYRNNLARSELIIMDQAGDTIAIKKALPGQPVALFKDCLDYIHLLTKEAAWQVIYTGDSLTLSYKSNLQKFAETFGNCVTNVGEKLVFKRYFNYRLSVEYYAVDKNSFKKNTIAIVEDDYKLNMLRRNADDRMNLEMAYGNREVSREIMGDATGNLTSGEALQALHHTLFESRFAGSVYYTPVLAPLKRMDETFIIFDFSNSKMRFFDPFGKQFYEVEITFHHKDKEPGVFERIFRSKDWDEYEIFVDEQRYKAYYLQTNGGRYELKEIDLYTGEIKKSIKLDHPFPEKILVSNGYAYYLYKSFGDWSKKRLYRQRLD